MKILRNYLNNVKPNFVGEGKYKKWFPLFDAIENLFFSYGKKTKNPIHVRDAVDIQKFMVTFGWLLFLLCFLVCIILVLIHLNI